MSQPIRLKAVSRILILPGISGDAAATTGRLATTRWSLILSAFDGQSNEGRTLGARAQLWRIYGRPIFAFICHKGYSVFDARDLIQDFALILEGELLQRAKRNRSCFRSLLKSLQNFLIDALTPDRMQRNARAISSLSAGIMDGGLDPSEHGKFPSIFGPQFP
jgi:hypothetical protein